MAAMLFVVMWSSMLVVMVYHFVKGRNIDFLFAPWPGFVFVFSSYFLLSTLALEFSVRDEQWFAYCLAIMGFLAGHVFYKGLSKSESFLTNGSNTKSEDEIVGAYVKSLRFDVILVLYTLSMVATVYMWYSSGVPLLSKNVDAARVAYLDNGYIATIASTLDVVAVFCFSYLISRVKGKSIYKDLFCILVITTFVIVAILAGSRSRLLKFAIPSVIIYHFFGKRLRVFHVAAGVVFAVLFIGMLGYFRNMSLYGDNISQGIGGGAEYWSIWEYVLFFAQKELRNGAYGLDIVMKTIPDSTGFTYGMLHVGPIVMPLKLGIPNPGDFFKNMIGGTWEGFGLAATFIAPMYADFSLAGVLGLSAIYSFILSKYFWGGYKESINSKYSIVSYSLLFYFSISGMRSDMVSFEVLWFLAISSVLKYLSIRSKSNRGVRRAPESASFKLLY